MQALAERTAFVVHPYDRADIERADPWFLRYSPTAFDAACRTVEPLHYGEVQWQNRRCDIYTLPLMPEMILRESDLALARLRTAVSLAVASGARLLGLGALVGSLAEHAAGIEAEHPGLRITSGNALTAAAVVQVAAAAAHGGKRVAVVGATGSLGRLCALGLGRLGVSLTLVGRHPQSLAVVALEIQQAGAAPPRCSLSLADAASRADVVVLAVGVAQPIADASVFCHGATVIDIARPPSLDAELAAQRPDLDVVEGVYLRPSGAFAVSCDLHMPTGLLYPCLAETMLLASVTCTPSTLRGRRMPLSVIDWTWQHAQAAGLELVAQRNAHVEVAA